MPTVSLVSLDFVSTAFIAEDSGGSALSEDAPGAAERDDKLDARILCEGDDRCGSRVVGIAATAVASGELAGCPMAMGYLAAWC
eukprot:scaffold46171_cov29-Tisochrysis_lutea.AAC.3